jgi:hypothetical protein
MRFAIAISALMLASGCQTPKSAFPAEAGGYITPTELAYSFDSAVKSRLIIFTTADRNCTLKMAETLAVEAGEPEPGMSEDLPQVYVEGSSGLKRVDNSISNRELLAARLVGEAARKCQVGS